MIRPRHAYPIARLLYGADPNGTMDGLPPDLRMVANHLAGLPVGDRGAAWQHMVAARPDGDALTRAVMAVDPAAEPPPEDDDGPGDEDWPPIRWRSLPPAAPFPVDVLPRPARDLVAAASEAIGCPVDFPAVGCLAAASGAIGRSAIILVKPGYHESACLYAAIVGRPSSGKTPALSAALRPLWAIARDEHQRYRAAMDRWEAAPADEKGPKPELVRLTTSDPTTEAIGPILAKNPRGLMVAPDEFTKFVMSMDQYKGGRGGDRPYYLAIWSGQPIEVDRAKHMDVPIYVPHPYLSVVGGLVPAMLGELSEGKGRDDGFIARLLVAYPEGRRTYSESGIPEPIASAWDGLVRRLWGRPMVAVDGHPSPHVVRMSEPARRRYFDFARAHHDEMQADDFPESLDGAWGKLDAHAARLALVLHLMDLAANPAPALDEPPEVPERIIEDAIRLIGYFKAHALRLDAAIRGPARDGGDAVRSIVRWLRRHGHERFTERDLKRALPRLGADEIALADALAWMVDAHLVRPEAAPETTGRRGRKPSPDYAVSPRLTPL